LPLLRLLPEATQRLIRAGETLEHLAAIVRELVDNALDAGADRIVVHFEPERWQVRVSDNGVGLSADDLTLVAHRHTTSKIYAPEDLQQIQSLGFRGEALHALSAVSDLEIASCLKASAAGWRAHYDHQGECCQIEPCGLAPGTIVTARNIFGTLPVRRQFLQIRQENQQVLQTIRSLALAHPHLTLQLKINDRNRLFFPGVTTQLRRLSQVLGIAEQDLRSVQQASALGTLELVVGLPDNVSRPRPDQIFVGINGRLIQDADLQLTLQKSFTRTLPKGRSPVALLHLQLDPQRIDWNRHPAKQTVHLGDRPQLETWVQGAVQEALGGVTPRTPINFFKVAEEKAIYQTTAPLVQVRALIQLQGMYILAEHQEELWLVEQHVCHERVLFERIMVDWQIVSCEAQLLQRLRPQQVENLERLGLDIESFGEGLWAVRTLPQLLVDRTDIPDALWELSRHPDPEAARVTLACRTAIKNGTPVNLDWAQELIDQWQQCQNPHTCPHGRPIYLSLNSHDLGQYFRRRWRVCDNSETALRERLSDRF
jgi:DNA mismatch repair protein MutL